MAHTLTEDVRATLTAFFQWVDTDADGYITVDEIQAACAVDFDGDGVISDAEKIKAGQQWIDINFPLQDSNGDTRITLEELLAFNVSN